MERDKSVDDVEYERFSSQYKGDIIREYRDTFNCNATLSDPHYLLIANAVLGPESFKTHHLTYVKGIVVGYKLRLLDDLQHFLSVLKRHATIKTDEPQLLASELRDPPAFVNMLSLHTIVGGVDANLLARQEVFSEATKNVRDVETSVNNIVSHWRGGHQDIASIGEWIDGELIGKITDEKSRLQTEAAGDRPVEVVTGKDVTGSYFKGSDIVITEPGLCSKKPYGQAEMTALEAHVETPANIFEDAQNQVKAQVTEIESEATVNAGKENN